MVNNIDFSDIRKNVLWF